MKKLFMTMALAAFALSSWAVPAKRVSKTVTMADGTTAVVQLCGDETMHFYRTQQGQIVREGDDGLWVNDTRDVQALWAQRTAARNKSRMANAQKFQKAMRAKRAPLRADAEDVPTKRGLLILVNFSDKAMVNGANSQKIFDQMLNAIGNPYGKNYGSIREYFRAQSYNQFDIEFDVVGPVTLSKTMSYYGQDNGGEGNDAHPGEMVKEACNLVDDQVNFADYDWDGDGEVENIYVTYAGYGQASGAPSNTIWPHQWALSEATGSALRLDGVKIDTYACGSELDGTSGTTIDGIGTMCHEYSHCLGLPDFYDTNNVNYGMGSWSLMDYGCYNGDGYHPAGYTAYERWFSGWLTPVELNSGTTVTDMPNIEENPVAYILYNDKNRNEYYMLANHQQRGWDMQAPGHGMMVLHVDYSQSVWYNNTVNNTSSRQRMTLIPADNSLSERTEAYDLWPSTRKKTALTDETTPAATLYNANTDGKKFMHKPITDIAESNRLISFTFMGGEAEEKIAAPELAEATAVTATGFTAVWSEVEGAVSYNLSYTVTDGNNDDEGGEVLDALNMLEDFENFYVEDQSATSDASTDISAKLDEYTYVQGWTGSKIYQGLFGAKMGSSKAKGVLTSPLVQGTTGKVTLYLMLSDWFNFNTLYNTGSYRFDGSTVTINILDAEGTVVKSETVTPGQISDDGYYYLEPEPNVVTIDGVPAQYKVSIESSKRLYALYFLSFDGAFSQDEIETLFEEEEEEAPARINGLKWGRKALRRSARRAASEPVLVQNITATQYALTDLPEGATVTYTVQAVDAEGNTSVWSNEQSVTLAEGTAVQSLEATTPAARTEFFDLMGRRVSTPAARGLYVGGCRKIIVR